MRIGTMIGDAVERTPFVKSMVMRLRGKLRKRKNRCRLVHSASERKAYAAWVRDHDTPSARDLATMRDSINGFVVRPTISVVMPVFNTPPLLLEAAIESVRGQVYDRLELCISDDASGDPDVRKILQRYAASDSRIKVNFRDTNGGISANSNTALELTNGEFVALLDHDDVLPLHALYWVAEAINRHPDAALLYSDEDKIDAAGRRFNPYFKCDFNHELLLGQNMISHLGVYRRDLIVGLGGFRPEFDGAQDYDLALRVVASVSRNQIIHISRILYHWRAVEGSTAVSVDEKPTSVDAGRRAVADHLRCVGRGGTVEQAPDAPEFHRVRNPLPPFLPLVSIVICTRDNGDVLRTAIDSITSRTTYGNYDILVVDNGSRDVKTLAYLASLAGRSRISVVRDDSPFNYSRLNNAAVAQTRGEVVCLLNDDIEVISADWLEELVSHVIRPGVGAVGARLWYPDGTLQHGGVIIGIGGVAGHAHPRLPIGCSGYFNRAVLQQELSAVTGACLVVRRPIFEAMNGLDEELAVAFNDIDFCLRLRAAGYRNIWTPFAELVHHESLSRGPEDTPAKRERFQREIQFMERRWMDTLKKDPYYNPNLSTLTANYSLPARIA